MQTPSNRLWKILQEYQAENLAHENLGKIYDRSPKPQGSGHSTPVYQNFQVNFQIP